VPTRAANIYLIKWAALLNYNVLAHNRSEDDMVTMSSDSGVAKATDFIMGNYPGFWPVYLLKGTQA
jgi:hypothetical protein